MDSLVGHPLFVVVAGARQRVREAEEQVCAPLEDARAKRRKTRHHHDEVAWKEAGAEIDVLVELQHT